MSAIDKRPVDGPVSVHRLGLAGDVQVDHKHHGGPRAGRLRVRREDMATWAERLGRALPPGSFGENLTLSGLDVTEARIGERWRIGTVTLEVGDVRIPCNTFQTWLQEAGWVRRFTAEGRPGAYLRVIEQGTLQAGDQVEVIETRDHDVTVGLMFRALTTERALLPGCSRSPGCVHRRSSRPASTPSRTPRLPPGSGLFYPLSPPGPAKDVHVDDDADHR